jgi:hypothetical protein
MKSSFIRFARVSGKEKPASPDAGSDWKAVAITAS